MTTTSLTLNENQQEVVDRLRALPGARKVTIESNIYVSDNGTTHSSMEIHGGADGPEPDRCQSCGHRDGKSFISVTFVWSDNHYYKTRISVNHGAKKRPPRRRIGQKAGLEFMERFCQEEFMPTVEDIK